MKGGGQEEKSQGEASGSVENAPQILDIHDFDVVKVINNAGVRLTVQCTRKSDGKVFYVKETYKDEWSASEVLSPEVMKLSGIVVPKNYLMIHTDTHPAFKEHHAKLAQEGKLPAKLPRFAVASEEIKGFIDIGQFIENRSKENVSASSVASSMPASASRVQAPTGEAESKIASEQHRPKKLSTLTPKQREKAVTLRRLGKDFASLPNADKVLIEELLPVAQWVGDWDFLNIKGYNSGFAVRKSGKKPAKVDLGNCLEVGYQGKIKTESHSKINEPALPDDPPLAEKYRVTELAAELREGGAMRLLSTIPRRYTIDALFPKLEETIVTILSDSKEAGKLTDGYAKGLYRLSLMSDASIRKNFSHEALSKKGLTDFYPAGKATKLADILIARRDSLVGAGDDMGQAVRAWKNNPRNHVERLVMEREVRKAAGENLQRAVDI